MRLIKNRWFQVAVAIAVCSILILFFLWFSSVDHRKIAGKSPERFPVPASEPGSFSFFDLNAGSRFSTALRSVLNEKLGADAYETRTVIDLELHEKGFLAENFPGLDALNRQLNYLPGERVEHDTVQLTYRYARHENTPFEFVRIMFSGDSDAPLFIKIQAKQEGVGVLDSIRVKYGPPATRQWVDGNGKSHFWEKQGDLLIISETKNRIGTPQYHFGFYFVNNIKALLEKEQAARLQHRKGLEKTGQTAF
ncbi:MAG: hypothetical protein V2B19_19585 [Pseudomonadota bacterium]